MSERQLQFRVGVFVILAMVAMIVMVFEFGNLQNRLRPKYKVAIRFKSAVGIAVGTPVRRNGVLIGSVTGVDFDDKSGGLIVHTEIRDGIRTCRGLRIRSLHYGIAGRADVVEFRPDEGPRPVEYKRGKPKATDMDEVQLCAQALCLEEMLNVSIPEGSLFYGEPRRRTAVVFDQALRQRT